LRRAAAPGEGDVSTVVALSAADSRRRFAREWTE